MTAGLELCRRFYDEVVRHIVDVPHSAALMGRGSEVLGFDDEMSTDHNCEARVLLFVADGVELHPEVPDTFEGRAALVEVHTLRDYFLKQLSFDVDTELTPMDWLTFPESILRQHTAGGVFHDELGLQAIRDRLAYYPDDLWRYLMITAWWRVHPEMNLVGRVGYVGDELGSSRAIGALHNLRGITEPVELGVEQMCGRPFKVVWGDFIGKLTAQIEDPGVLRILERWRVGGIEQVRDAFWLPADRRQLVGLLDAR